MEGEPQTATFEDLSIDDSLGALARVRQYGTSAIALQRLVHVKMLTDAAESVPYESIQTDLFPLLRALSMDNEWVIRQHLGEQLGGVAAACLREAEGEDGPGYRGIIESILPLIQTLLNDSQDEVRQSSGASLCHICSLLAPEDRGRRALTLALQLAHDDEQEDLRMTAAKLLNDMVEILGPDLCTQFVSPELVSLAEDPVFRVRKAAALALHSACRVAGEADAVDRLLPAFIRLTKDDIYRVRKACAEALVDMSTAVSPGLRGHVLLEVFTRLAGDASKLVRQAAMQQLGPFLSTLPAAKVSDALLEMFAGMAAADTGDPTLDRDMRGYCAYNLPGVMAAVGPSRWRPFLKEAYGRLVRDGVWTVRRTLACSLHEMVRVMGGEGRGRRGGRERRWRGGGVAGKRGVWRATRSG
ncbi:protein phosphatase 4 regulatory subunit 1 [Nannochloropsis gaditana]|uniref:Protein phosphatase 4 regulatory subunit 1 n=2 Tax=Nannochloropsis gaditana TaxID=72520 RepID=W7T2P8_9STRA|nr:protein phosphatase 4 regulatory subunit 1 [Nannochloropsis gaditana]